MDYTNNDMQPKSIKRRAANLRERGYSYSMISSRLGLAKSTLSDWLRDIPFSPNQQVIERVGEARLKSARFKNRQRIRDIALMRSVAKSDLGNISRRDLWFLGIGLYLGEGTKNNEHIRIINSDPKIIQLAITWFKGVCDLKTENFSPAVHLYPDNNLEETLRFWSKTLQIPLSQFGKTQIDKRQGKAVKKRGKLPYGTVHLYIKSCRKKKFGRRLHRRIMGWIEVCFNQIIE